MTKKFENPTQLVESAQTAMANLPHGEDVEAAQIAMADLQRREEIEALTRATSQ